MQEPWQRKVISQLIFQRLGAEPGHKRVGSRRQRAPMDC
eukprot:jgi/Botrbrau1/18282/Bobra.0179s0014.1